MRSACSPATDTITGKVPGTMPSLPFWEILAPQSTQESTILDLVSVDFLLRSKIHDLIAGVHLHDCPDYQMRAAQSHTSAEALNGYPLSLDH